MINKILCADDDTITLMLLKKVIEKVNFAKEIITAMNGQEALDYFNSFPKNHLDKNNDNVEYPTLVLLDLNMPVMNGWEFLDLYSDNNFQDSFPLTKFIILSSTIDPQDIKKSKSYPFVIDFISKPITKEILENIQVKL